MAWWHAVPDDPPSRAKGPPPTLQKLSRLDARINGGGVIDLPPLEQCLMPYVAMLFDAGPAVASGFGPAPLTWAEIESWDRLSGVSLDPWEASMLRRLSADYLSASAAAKAHDAPPPWNREINEDVRAKVGAHIKRLLRG